jgi:hypothetical protein
MYDLYRVDKDLQLTNLNKEIKDLRESYDRLLAYFKNNTLKFYFNFNIEDVLAGTQQLVEIPLSSTDKYFNIQLNHFNIIRAQYNSKQDEKIRILNDTVNSKIFFFIIQRFNELLVQAMIKEAYSFYHLFIGKFTIIINKSPRKIINWGKSLKRKQALLNNNEVPYCKKDADSAKEDGEDYKGVEWLSYLSSYNFYFSWIVCGAQYLRIPNIRMFSFIPYRGDKSPTAYLTTHRNTYTEDQLINLYNTRNDAN